MTAINIRILRRCSDVSILQKGLESQEKQEIIAAEGESEPDGSGGKKIRPPLLSFIDILNKFCLEKNLKKKNPIYSHIKAIFVTGWKGSRLEISELIKHTTSRLLRSNSFLRALLALFIVLGLLGTLFGLADSLSALSSGLSPALAKQDLQKSNADLRDVLGILFIHLKSAFAPSIWGVFLTILGVSFFSLYLKLVCTPLKESLEDVTLNIWIPRLIPTSPQRLIERSEQQMHRSLDAVEKVVDFAQDIQSEAGDLKGNLRNANEILVPLFKSAVDIKEFTEKFKNSTDKISSFQTEIRNLYEHMIKDSSIFHGNVQDLIKRSDQFQIDTRNSLLAQNTQFQEILKSLKNYEESYAKHREERDQESRSTLEEAKRIYAQVVETNKEQIVHIDEKLGIPVANKLSALNETLDAKMKEIRDSFSAMDAPLQRAADKIGDSLQTFDTHLMSNLEELKLEFARQTTDREGQLNVLRESSEKIITLIGSLKKASESLEKSNDAQTINIQSLAKVLSLLSEKLGLLGASIGIIPQKIDDSYKVTEQLKRAIDELQEEIRKRLKKPLPISEGILDLGGLVPRANAYPPEPEPEEEILPPRIPPPKNFLEKVWRFLNKKIVLTKKKKHGRRR